MLIYQTKFRTPTLVVRIFITFLSCILFLTGLLAVVGMLISQKSDTTAVVFVVMTITVSFFIFKASGWSIRSYLIYDDRLVVRTLGGIRSRIHLRESLIAFNDLKVLVQSQEAGIGIVTTDNELIKIPELEIADFPAFILELQKIVRWDLNLTYNVSRS